VSDFKIITPKEWDSVISRMECPTCGEPMILLAVNLGVMNVMKVTMNPFEKVNYGMETELQHMGFDLTVKATDRCPACMGEFTRVYHIEEKERVQFMNMLASVITR
jgi:hypothetical protein